MPWPSRSDYTQAIRDYPKISILDPTLAGGYPRKGPDKNLTSYAGGYSSVFPIKMSSNTYALRCWIADIKDLEFRYREISKYLKECDLPYFVDFEFVPEGILVNGTKYPITRMKWAAGETLCNFIEQNLHDARCLKTAAVEFKKMVKTLHTYRISHGDLQDGNIVLNRNGRDVKIKLIDYDSLFVPSLLEQSQTILGIPEYQHPQRFKGGGDGREKADYFSELVIYLSLLSLVEKPALWNQFGNSTEKGLLFTAKDFEEPDQSDVFKVLENLSLDVKQLASTLKDFCRLTSLTQLAPLEAVSQKPDIATSSNRGWAYLNSEQYNQAIVEFQNVIAINPNYKDVHRGLGLAYQRGTQYDLAIAEFQKAIVINPKHKEAHYVLGLAYFKIGNLGNAKKAAEAALKIDANYQLAIDLLKILPNEKTTLLAQRDRPPQKASKQIKQNPSNFGAAPPKLLYSENYECAKANNCGLVAFHRHWYDNPRHWIDIAIRFFNKAIKIDGEIAVIHYNLGCTYLVAKEYTNAVISLGEATILNPNFKEVHYNLALTYLRAGFHQAAISEAKEALNIDKNFRLACRLVEVIEQLIEIGVPMGWASREW